MAKRILAALLALAALVAWERSLSARERAERRDSMRIGRLVSKEEREGRTLAALRVEQAGAAHAYARVGGRWRCTTYRGALASEDRINSLLKNLFEAEGIVQTRDRAREADYGLAASEAARLEFLEPDGKPLLSFELGRSTGDGEGAFLRRTGAAEIWSVDQDPHAELDRSSAPGLPPLHELTVVPAGWPGSARTLQRIEVERAGQPPYALELRERAVTPEEMREGASPFEWILVRGGPGGPEEPCAPPLGVGYSTFLTRAPYAEVLEPALAAEMGLDRPVARVALVPAEGEPCSVVLAPSQHVDRMVVACDAAGMAYAVLPEVAELLFPAPEMLLPTAPGNPWDPWLRR
jgi:hypothetical protein